MTRDYTHGFGNPGFGAMGMSFAYGKRDDEQSKKTLRKAIEIGNCFWDTADMYGQGHNEELIGEVLKEPGNREKVFLVTKFGNTPKGVNGTPEYVKEAIDNSIKRLGTKPDAWILHRIDKKTPIEDTVTAMEEQRKLGKCKYIGLSECSAETLKRASKVAKIDFVEIEYSPWELVIEENGVLDACKELDIAILAYSPLGRGFLTGRFKTYEDFAKDDEDLRKHFPRMQKEVFEHNYKIVEEMQKVAEKKGCSTTQLSLAWLMAQSPLIIPIPGTRSEDRLVENFDSRKINLSQQELDELRKIFTANKPKGTRYPERMMATLDE